MSQEYFIFIIESCMGDLFIDIYFYSRYAIERVHKRRDSDSRSFSLIRLSHQEHGMMFA